MSLKVAKPKKNYRIGREIIADFRYCDKRVIDDVDLMKRLTEEAVRTTKHHLLDITARKFQPIGVTILGLLAESHISLHTYPEIGYVAVDIFTCGQNKPEPILKYLEEKLGAKEVYWEYIRRGTMRQWQTTYEFDGYKQQIEIEKLLHRRTTPYQILEVVKAKNLGTCLISDGILQVAEFDAAAYDKQILKNIGKSKSVLIVGGGDCSVLKELVKNKNIKEIFLFERDQQVLEVAQKYLGASVALKDSRVKMFFGDAIENIEYLKDKKLDFAVIDVVPVGDKREKKFYDQLIKVLHKNGVKNIATQGGNYLNKKSVDIVIDAINKNYKKTTIEDVYFFSMGKVKFIYASNLK